MVRNTGFRNEVELKEALNNKRLKSIIQPHLREFIRDLFGNNLSPDTLIKCETVRAKKLRKNGKNNYINVKQDLIISVDNCEKYVSVKTGKSNSVHEENINTFINFLKRLGADGTVINALLKFHWADGTVDNTGDKKNRLKGKEVVKVYYKEMEIVHDFINKNKLPIIKRVLSDGTYDILDSRVDYIYHGTIHSGVWCSLERAVEINNDSNNKKRPISIGFLTFQNQNRNTTLNPNKENARKQIQFKWSNMESILEKNMDTNIRILSKNKIKGNNKHGFDNIQYIHYALNGSQIKHLKNNLKLFITDIFPKSNNNSIVTVEKIGQNQKGSLDITVGTDTIRVLIKLGKGNSVHQEKFQDFYEYLTTELEADHTVVNAFKMIQWGDGTITGDTDSSDWLNTNEIKKKFSKEVNICNSFINKEHIARSLLHRFLVGGYKENETPVEYVYFGDINSASWARVKDIIDLQVKKINTRSRAMLHIGNFNIQSWGRTIKKNTGEDQRTSLQVKATHLKEDIIEISKSSEKSRYYEKGKEAEISFVQSINNRNISYPVFEEGESFVAENKKNYYAVQVDTRQESSLTGRKENTKSDAYFISTHEELNDAVLYEMDYYLKERNLSDIPYRIVNNSGVSIKMKNSKNITYAKLSRTAFENLFKGNSHLFVGALLYVEKESDFMKNIVILNDNGYTLSSLADSFKLELNIQDKKSTYRLIKKSALENIKYLIENNLEIKKSLIFGTNIFNDPYSATYLYKNSFEYIDDIIETLPFSITTGSGRSKGRYTIVVKP